MNTLPDRREVRRRLHRGSAMTARQETLLALIFGLAGLIVTLLAVTNLDSLRAGFAEWDTANDVVAKLPAGE